MEKGIRNTGNLGTQKFDICLEGARWISENDKTAEVLVTINGKTELSIIKFSLSLGHPFTIFEREDELKVFHPHYVRCRRGELDSLLRQYLGLNTLDWMGKFQG